MKPWTNAELDIITKYYPNDGIKIYKMLQDRSSQAIHVKARRLGIKYIGLKHNHKNISGQRFGLLTVKSISHKNRQVYWHCICDCGNTTVVRCDALICGDVLSCGCYGIQIRRDLLYTGGQYITGQQFANIRNGAKQRKLEFNITVQDIEEIFQQQKYRCVFSGIILCFNTTHKAGNGRIICGNASVDRIDSSEGYIRSNIQIVHKDINIAKQAKSDQDFIQMCHTISNYQKHKNQ